MQRKRGRGRRSGGNNNNNSNNPNRHYESTGPDVKIRGSAQQILDKYQQYARDALTAGDRVKAEAHFQHAEHYARIVASFQKDKPRNKSDDNNNDNNTDGYDDESSENSSDSNASNPSDNRSDRRSDHKSGNDGSDNSGSNQTQQGDEDKAPAKKPRASRSRKPKSEDDPLKVIDADNAPSDASGDKPGEAKSEEKPKRRTYRKKADADAGKETEGVMSTLSRGRSKSSDDTSEKSPAEAAE